MEAVALVPLQLLGSLVERNCAVRRVAERYGQPRSREIGFLRDALPDAAIERVVPLASGRFACAHEIRRTINPNRKEM